MKPLLNSIKRFIRLIIRKLFIENTPLQGYVAHTPHGAFTVYAAVYIHWVVALLFGVGFIIFEWWQHKAKGDLPHQDIAGWLLGIVIAGLVYWILG